jgi:hypothetical protein
MKRTLTFREKCMAHFSAQAVSRPMGRPLGQPVTTFASLLFARLYGHSRRRAEEILANNPNAASGAIWAVASDAAAAGVMTGDQFLEWLQREKDQPANL